MSSFNEFWLAYPRRKGSNPKAPAEQKYNLAIKKGADPQHILSSVRRYAEELKAQGKIYTEFVCQARTWLSQRRWEDFAIDPAMCEKEAKVNQFMADKGWGWNEANKKWEKTRPDAEDLL